jgi:hypothetical protein
MTVTKEQLDNLFAAIGGTTSDWYKNTMRLYHKSMSGRLTTTEKVDWQRIQDRNYIDFADTPEAQTTINFLNAYLKAGTDLQSEYYTKAAKVFTPGQFAVIAVRLDSVQVLDLGVYYSIDYLSKSHDYNLITELKLIYSSAIFLNQDPDAYFQQHLPKIEDKWSLSFVQGFLSQDKTEKLNNGYKGVYEPNFGYIKEQKQRTTSASKNKGRSTWFNFLSLFSSRK